MSSPPPLPRRNPIASFFVGLWDVMNFTRRLILNLLFFGLLLLMLVVFLLEGDIRYSCSQTLA